MIVEGTRVRLGVGGALFLAATVAVSASTSDLRLVDAVRNGDREAVRSLLHEHVDVNARQPDGATALAWAVYRDEGEIVDLLIQRGAEVNAANDYGVTPLWLACANRNAAIVDRLLKAGANPSAAIWTGETVLMTCARSGTVAPVTSLVARGANVNAKEPRRGQTALMWAAAAKHPDVVRTLIEQGADVRARTHPWSDFKPVVFATWRAEVPANSPGGFTALLFAAQQGDLESARLLVAAGADVNEVAPDGVTPLLMATTSGHEPLALFLLQKGANPNAADASGATALHYALREGIKLVHGLVEGGDTQPIHSSDPNATAKISQLLLVSSTKRPPSPILPGPNMPDLVKALLARGANPNARLAEIPPLLRLERRPPLSLLDATPFLLAAASGDVASMRGLLEHGAKPLVATRVDEKQLSEEGYSDDAQIQGDATPLHVAAGMGRTPDFSKEEEPAALEAVKLLVSLGADVSAATATGWTALHAAVDTGADSIVRFLVEEGANIDAQNGCGQTPLSLAQGNNVRGLLERGKVRASTVALLHQLGASPNPVGRPVGKCVEGRYGI